MNRAGRGIWAGSIRHHAGKYWVYFGTPDEGFFMSTARHAEGPWEPVKAVMPVAGWDDPCPFWDDDGRPCAAESCGCAFIARRRSMPATTDLPRSMSIA